MLFFSKVVSADYQRDVVSLGQQPVIVGKSLQRLHGSSEEKLFLELRLCMEPVQDYFYPDKAIGSISIVHDYSRYRYNYKIQLQTISVCR